MPVTSKQEETLHWHRHKYPVKTRNSQGEGVLHKAAVSEPTHPQLDADDAEYEEDEEAEQQHVAQHGQGVQQQGHQDTHTWERERRQTSEVKQPAAHHTPIQTQRIYTMGWVYVTVK